MIEFTNTAPTTVAFIFADGEMPLAPKSLNGQATYATRHYASGNVLHLRACGVFEAGKHELSYEEVLGPNLTVGDIRATSPEAAVSHGDDVIYLSDVLDNDPAKIYCSIPTMCEALWKHRFDSGIEVRFQVRQFLEASWVRVIIERNDPARGSSIDHGIVEPLTITIDDVEVYYSESLTLCKNGKISQERFMGTEQFPHKIKHDTAKMQTTGLIPNMGWIRNAPPIYGISKYVPGELGDYKDGMAAGGVTQELGPVPGWVARWLASDGNADAWEIVIANGHCAGYYPVTWRNEDDGEMLSPSKYSQIGFNGIDGKGSNTFQNGIAQFDDAHNPSMIMPYIITGDPYFLDTAIGNVAAMYMLGATDGEGVNKKNRRQTRATAWYIRALAEICNFMPDSHYNRSEYSQLLWTQIKAAIAAGPDKSPDSKLGFPWVKAGNPKNKDGSPASITSSPWMQSFWAWAVAYAARTDALFGNNKDEAKRLAEWMLQQAVYSVDGCIDHGADYRIKISDSGIRYFAERIESEKLYQDWNKVRDVNYPDYVCTNTLLGNKAVGANGVNSHWAQKMPLFAEAFNYGIPGIEKVWDEIRSAKNYEQDIYGKNWGWGGWGVTGKGQEIDPLPVVIVDPIPDPGPDPVPIPDPIDPVEPIVTDDYKVSPPRVNGRVPLDWFRKLPKNTRFVVTGFTSNIVEQLFMDELDCDWRGITGYPSWLRTQNSWCAPIIDWKRESVVNDSGAGHDMKKYPGTAGIFVPGLSPALLDCPNNPTALQAGHHYGTLVRDESNDVNYRIRGKTRHDMVTNEYTKFYPLNDTGTGFTVYWDSLAEYNRFTGKAYGTIRKQYENSCWKECDLETGIVTNIGDPKLMAIPSNGATSKCRIDDAHTLWRHADKDGSDFISLWNEESEEWIFKWKRVTGQPNDWLTGIKFNSDHGLSAISYFAPWDKCWSMQHAGPDAWVETLLDPISAEQRKIQIKGASLPRTKHTLGKTFTWKLADDITIAVWWFASSDTEEMVRIAVLDELQDGDIVYISDDPIPVPDPVPDPLPDPLPDPIPDPGVPSDPVPAPDLAAILLNHERRIESLEKARQGMIDSLVEDKI